MMVAIDLNADVGEGAPGADDELLDLVTSASVACGFHAGSPEVMHRTVLAAAARGVVVGAHPGYPDREGFGRRDFDRSPERVAEDVLYQIGALDAVARRCGTRVRYVKPHGALYHRIDRDLRCAQAVAQAVKSLGDLVLLVSAGSNAAAVAEELGVLVATEAFADRAYLGDGRLAPRDLEGAVITDPDAVAERVVALAVRGEVTAVDGTLLSLRASSICLHADTPGSVGLARHVRAVLGEAGVRLRPLAS